MKNATIDTFRNAALLFGWDNFRTFRTGDATTVSFDVPAKNGNGFWNWAFEVRTDGSLYDLASKGWGDDNGARGESRIVNADKAVKAFGLYFTAKIAA